VLPPGAASTALAKAQAVAIRAESGASHGLAVLVALEGDAAGAGGRICIGVADAAGAVAREARLVGNRDWVRLGAAELGLDVLRRRLLGLPVDEQVDFERR
jgi:nicotinamide-nucleotide amidase